MTASLGANGECGKNKGEFCRDGSKFLRSGSSFTSSEAPTKKLITFKSQLLGYTGTATTAITFTWNVCYYNKITSQKLLPVYCCLLLSPIPTVFTCQHRRPFIGKGVCKRKGAFKKLRCLQLLDLVQVLFSLETKVGNNRGLGLLWCQPF